MAEKPKLHYSNARGRMESTRWLPAAAGVEVEKFLESAEDLEKLRNDGSFMFQQMPMVKIDGMKLVQTRAILNYIASKYNLYRKDIKERVLIDMYTEGIADLDTKLALIQQRTKNRYFPAFEKISESNGQDYLVGNKLSWADIHLVELLYYMEELDSSLIFSFPLLKALKTRISNLPMVKKFLQPGSPRKSLMDEKSLEEARKIFRF
uniref:glutathione transferase n=1 Tax=Pan troglodytes TaxID=9598 RepID=A0A2I3SV32_PANTR